MVRITKGKSKGIEKLELRRQLFHLFLGLILVFLIYFDIIGKVTLTVILILGFIISLVCRRVEVPGVEWFLRKFERREVISRFPGRGSIFFIMGSLLVLALFEKNIALAGIMILTLGDSLSHIFGKAIGKYFLYNLKAIEGIAIGICVSFFGALLFVKPLGAFLGSLVAMIVEGYQLKIGEYGFDDNLIVPLIASSIIYLTTLI